MSNSLRDELIGNQVDLMRLEAEKQRETRQRVAELFAAILALVVLKNPTDVVMLHARRARLEGLLASVGDEVRQAYRQISKETLSGSKALRVVQARFINDAISRLTGDVKSGQVDSADIADVLIFGATIKSWWDRAAKDLIWRLGLALRNAVHGNLDIDKTVALIKGLQAAALANSDGLVRAFIAQTAADAARDVFQARKDVVEGIVQISVMDNRTTAICRRYNLAEWDLDYQPIHGNTLDYAGGVPRHWGCRSIEVPVVDGAIADDTTFEEWLSAQTEERQRDILGKLFSGWRRGSFSFADMADMRGNPMTFDEYRKRYG